MLCKLLRAATFYYSYVHESVLSRRTSPVSPGKMGTICRGVVPSNTKNWAVRVFEEWRREPNATATGEQCPLELLEKLTGCRSVTLPSPRHEQPKMSPYSPLQMVPIFPGETGEVNLRFAGDFFFCSNATRNRTGRRDKALSSTYTLASFPGSPSLVPRPLPPGEGSGDFRGFLGRVGGLERIMSRVKIYS